jgi:hypothetical protein
MPSRVDSTLPEWEQVEYMQPRFLSFALGAQAVARDLDADALKRIASFLPANPRSDFLSAHRSLRDQREGLLDQLGIAGAKPRVGERHFNAGLVVFRVKRRWSFLTPRCSDPDCRTKIPEGTEACPGCGGTVRGAVASEEEARERETASLSRPMETDDLSRLLKGR